MHSHMQPIMHACMHAYEHNYMYTWTRICIRRLLPRVTEAPPMSWQKQEEPKISYSCSLLKNKLHYLLVLSMSPGRTS